MIEGLKIELHSDELREHLLRKADQHTDKARAYKKQADEVSKLADANAAMSNDPAHLDDEFLADVQEELRKARRQHAPINSAHEGYAVILEEVDEFWLEVKKRREARDPEAVYRELIQVAAMAARTATDTVDRLKEQA